MILPSLCNKMNYIEQQSSAVSFLPSVEDSIGYIESLNNGYGIQPPPVASVPSSDNNNNNVELILSSINHHQHHDESEQQQNEQVNNSEDKADNIDNSTHNIGNNELVSFDEHDYYQRVEDIVTAPNETVVQSQVDESSGIVLEFLKDTNLMVAHTVEVSQASPSPSPTKQPKVILSSKYNRTSASNVATVLFPQTISHQHQQTQQQHQQQQLHQQKSLLNLDKFKLVNNVRSYQPQQQQLMHHYQPTMTQQSKPSPQFAPIKYKLHSSTRKRNSASVSHTHVDNNTAVSGRNRNSTSISISNAETVSKPTYKGSSVSKNISLSTPKPTKRSYSRKKETPTKPPPPPPSVPKAKIPKVPATKKTPSPPAPMTPIPAKPVLLSKSSSRISPLIATAFSASFHSVKLDKNNNKKIAAVVNNAKQSRTKASPSAMATTAATVKIRKNAKKIEMKDEPEVRQKRKYTRRKPLVPKASKKAKVEQEKSSSEEEEEEFSDDEIDEFLFELTESLPINSNNNDSSPVTSNNINKDNDSTTNLTDRSSSSGTLMTNTSETTNQTDTLNSRSLSNIPKLLQNTRRFHVLSPTAEQTATTSVSSESAATLNNGALSQSSSSTNSSGTNSNATPASVLINTSSSPHQSRSPMSSNSHKATAATSFSATGSNSSSSMITVSNAAIYRRNPFELVPCHQFDPNEVPFYVKIKSDTLAIMDLHAHCLKTEVIGLLGGYYCRVTKTLHIETAEPCPSICNDSIRCEIDPVSQAIALEKVEMQHYQVVGWYHSHPTFSPDPSLRDIETQTAYQQMFNQCSSSTGGGRPYVAFILSPFLKPDDKAISKRLNPSSSFQLSGPQQNNRGRRFYANDKLYDYCGNDTVSYRYFTPELNSLLASPYKCFWVSQRESGAAITLPGPSTSNGTGCGKISLQSMPYEVKLELRRDECLIPSITKKLSPMCQWIARDYPGSVVNLFRTFIRIGSITVNYLEKIIASLSHHLRLNCTDYECERIRQECIAILVHEFKRAAIEKANR